MFFCVMLQEQLVGGGVAGGGGAIAGGIIGSLGALLYNGFDNASLVDLDDVQTFEIIDNRTGVLHNLVIDEILENYPTLLESSVTEDELISIICNKLHKYNVDFSTESLKNIYDDRAKTLIETIMTEENVSESMDEAAIIYPEYKNEFKILKSYTSGVENIRTTETLLDYADRVATIVNTSDIPVKSQEQITSFVSVYVNSSELWENTLD